MQDHLVRGNLTYINGEVIPWRGRVAPARRNAREGVGYGTIFPLLEVRAGATRESRLICEHCTGAAISTNCVRLGKRYFMQLCNITASSRGNSSSISVKKAQVHRVR
jgi:hypothetical protein